MKTKKSQMGRRELPAELKRTARMSLFFTRSEMQAIEAAAGTEDVLRFSRRILLERLGLTSIAN